MLLFPILRPVFFLFLRQEIIREPKISAFDYPNGREIYSKPCWFLSAPCQAPDFFALQKSSRTSLTIKWSHLREDDFQGKPIGYYITYNPLNSTIDANFARVNFASNVTTITNLTAYTIYIINVSAVSSGGIGPTKTLKARTDEAGTIDS